MKNFGEQFLQKKYSKLHTSKEVEHEQKRKKRRGEETSQKPKEKIAAFMKVLERTHGHNDVQVLDRIKKAYHKQYVITSENIPDAVYKLEQRLAREQGNGTIEITDEFRERKNQEIIDGQKRSLDLWIDYLTSPDALYPTWQKYWAFISMVKMGKFEKQEVDGKEVGRFKKRRKDTAASFPPLNQAALAKVFEVVTAHLGEKVKPKKARVPLSNMSSTLTDAEFKQLISTEDFSKLYTTFLMEIPEYSTEGLKETRGKWVTYSQGSDPHPLVDSLKGYPLEWCTAVYDTANNQLQGGDFLVYYSYDQNGDARIPRVAIRMESDSIAEVRGVAPGQNLDPYIADVVSDKMDDFGSKGEVYKKKSKDMKLLTEIEEKSNNGAALTREEIRFLYEMDSKIKGFGYGGDPRIAEIKASRDMKADISRVAGCSRNEVSLTPEEALSGGIKYHYGDLILGQLTSAENVEFPAIVSGSIDLSNLESASNVKFPDSIGGDLYLFSLKSAEGLKLPDSIGGNLRLDGLKSAEGLKLPDSIGGDLHLESLTSIDGLELPDSISGRIILSNVSVEEKEQLKEKYPHLAEKIV